MLVGLLKAPSRYAPTSNPDLSEDRATQVLINMKVAGYLTDAQVAAAEENYGDEDSSYRDNHSFGAFYFSDYVLSLLPQDLINMKEDLVITTTLNVKWQQEAEDAVNAIMDKNGKAKKASQAALFSITPDGGIRAMVGGRNYRASQFNRVTQGLRQPGSSFKLFVYLAALENGYQPESQIVDQPINIGKWHPRDYTGKYMGSVTLRTAFAESLNSVAVQLSEAIGRDKVIEMARRLGISTPMEADPSIALGTNEVTLFDMTKAYAQVASDGVSVQPFAITKIETADGRKLFERVSPTTVEVLRDSTVKMMNDLLIAVTEEGTGKGARIGRPIAGKTGTTSDYKDAWFIGFTPQLITGVWVGNDDTAPMKKVSGGSLPASIWHTYMASATGGMPVASIPSESGPGVLQSLLPSWFSSPEPAPQTGPPPGSQPQQQAPIAVAPQEQPQQAPPAAQQPAEEPAAPEDQPVPEYNAPSSFWDKLMGDGKDNGQ
jgi:penicillin-binding protein 1A